MPHIFGFSGSSGLKDSRTHEYRTENGTCVIEVETNFGQTKQTPQRSGSLEIDQNGIGIGTHNRYPKYLAVPRRIET